MSRLRHLASALRAGWLRANASVHTDTGLTWLNEATLVGISVPAPRSIR